MCIGLRYKYALIKGVLYKPIDWNFRPNQNIKNYDTTTSD